MLCPAFGRIRFHYAPSGHHWHIGHKINNICRLRVYNGTTAAGKHSLAVPCPPEDYDHKADILPETLYVVREQYPELLPLVEEGNLVVYQRPASYVERRADGYQEPQLIFILGTAHVSQQAAAEVEQVVAVVQPQSVVVELCKSRVGILQTPQQELPLQWQQQQGQQPPRQLEARTPSRVSHSPSSSPDEDAAAAAAYKLVNSEEAQTSSASGPYSSKGRAAEQYWRRRNKVAASLVSPGGPAASARDAAAGSAYSSRQSSCDVDVSVSKHLGRATAPSSNSRDKASNPMSLTGTNFLSAITRSAQLGGQSGLLLRLLIAGQTHKVANQLGVQPGAEFRAAARAADAVGASLVLGDRPIEITLQRAWRALSWQRRMKLLADLLTAAVAPTGAEELTTDVVERLRSDDAVTTFFKALSAAYPELISPLIAERDLYLAWSLKRSKAVNGTHAVVGVVGKGHLRGTVYALKHDNGKLRFADLVGGKNRKQSRQEVMTTFAQRLFFEVLLGAGLYGAWLAVNDAARL